MAGFELNFSAIDELSGDFLEMENALKEGIKPVAKEIGNSLKRNTSMYLPKEEGSPKHGIHAADNVTMNVKNKSGRTTITVKGGSKTGSLWWIIDNGHVALNGKFVPGANFTDKAYNATDVEGPVEKLINKVANK